jgi:hypothetical protein
MKVSKKSQSELSTRLKDGRSLWRKKERRTAFLDKMEGHAISERKVKFCLKTCHPNTLVNYINL